MPTISLTLPVAGTVITAGLHSANYSALQTLLNGGLDNNNVTAGAGIAYSKLALTGSIVNADVATGAAIAGSKLATGLSGPPGAQVDYVEVTADATSTATTSAGAGTVITSSAVTYDGATPVWIEFFAPSVFHSVANTLVAFELYDSASDVAILGLGGSPSTTNGPSVRLTRKITPSAAAHTYSVRVWGISAGTSTVRGSLGNGAGVFMPTTLTIRKA